MNILAHDDTELLPGFVDADEVPADLLDDPPEQEGDDSVHAPGQEHRRLLSVKVPPFPLKSRARIVPFHRNIHFGTTGGDVVAVKRALSHAGYLKWPKRWSRNAGPVWRAAVRRFQKQHGLKATGVYEISTHRKLAGLGHFDKWGAHLMATAPRPKGQERHSGRDKIAAAALWGYHNRERIHYAQTRPIDGHRDPYKLPLRTDCSGIATDDYEWTGAPNPNGGVYNGEGYTGTLVRHGLPTSNIKPADLNFYGGGFPYHHVTVAVGASTCVSHGSEIGPLLLPIRYRPDYNHTRTYNP